MPIPRPDPQGDRVIAHVDMDCFYVQVEQRRQPKLRGLPTAVVQYNDWKGGGLIAVSYEARKFGVKRSMRGDEAEMVCPGIQLVQVPVARDKADLNVYRSAGSEVVSILSTKGRCERASIDEVYLDLTDAAESMLSEVPPEALEDIDKVALKSHVLGLSDDEDQEKNVRGWLCRSDALRQDKLLACGAIIVAQLRGDVLKETEFTCSAGIAHNKMLAKLASGMNKPAQQTIVPSSAVKDLLASLPVKKMKQLGGKLGTSLQIDLEVNTVGDLLKFPEEKLQERYGFNTGTWLWNVARGICGDEVKGRVLPKSHGCGKTFPGPKALKTSASVKHWLDQLCEELSERIQLDLDQNKRVAHTLTLHARAFKAGDVEPHNKFPSKSCPLRYGVNKVQEDAKRLFDLGLREFLGSHSKSWGVTSLAVSASKILDTPSHILSIYKYIQPAYPKFITVSNGDTTPVAGADNLQLTPILPLSSVLHVLGSPFNLLSVSHLTQERASHHITLRQPSRYLDSVHPKSITVASGDIIPVSGSADIHITSSITLRSDHKTHSSEWHRHLGRPPLNILRKALPDVSIREFTYHKVVTSADVTFLEDQPHHSQPSGSLLSPLLPRPDVLVTSNLPPPLSTPLPPNSPPLTTPLPHKPPITRVYTRHPPSSTIIWEMPSSYDILQPADSTTTSTAHPMTNYVSFHRLSPELRQFALSLSSITIPTSVQEALQHLGWRAAMDEEMFALWGLVYKPSSPPLSPSAYCDTDYAGSLDDRRSTSGYWTYFRGHLITWRSKKQSVVARSSAEAKYRSMTVVVSELTWLEGLLDDLGVKLSAPATLFCDSQAAIHIAKNHVFHERTKHIEVDCHFIREKVKLKKVELMHVPATESIYKVHSISIYVIMEKLAGVLSDVSSIKNFKLCLALSLSIKNFKFHEKLSNLLSRED
ncbi:hypothetical protein KSP39_PZI009451 [Platanthera zijinensis]|uniref:DNA polymerase eta n=1 Tax=Platanthera zijinensis TaxID=2320716 RepID=A0AAP0BL84_9ASPA